MHDDWTGLISDVDLRTKSICGNKDFHNEDDRVIVCDITSHSSRKWRTIAWMSNTNCGNEELSFTFILSEFSVVIERSLVKKRDSPSIQISFTSKRVKISIRPDSSPSLTDCIKAPLTTSWETWSCRTQGSYLLTQIRCRLLVGRSIFHLLLFEVETSRDMPSEKCS